VHKKTLSRLEQKMTEYDFIIQYKKGSEMPADFLSRNVLAEIDVFTPDLPILQQRDEFAHSVIEFLQKGSLPADRPTWPALPHRVSWRTASCGVESCVTMPQPEQCWYCRPR